MRGVVISSDRTTKRTTQTITNRRKIKTKIIGVYHQQQKEKQHKQPKQQNNNTILIYYYPPPSYTIKTLKKNIKKFVKKYWLINYIML